MQQHKHRRPHEIPHGEAHVGRQLAVQDLRGILAHLELDAAVAAERPDERGGQVATIPIKRLMIS